MKSKHIIYHTLAEFEDSIKEREAEVAMLPPGMTRQSVLAEVDRLRLYVRLRSYAGMKLASDE